MRQEPQLGTGHALQQAAPLLDDDGTTLVLNGDVPLIETETLQRAGRRRGPRRGSPCSPSSSPSRAATAASSARGDGARCDRAIVEEKDATAEQRAIREIYTGVMAAPTRALKRWLAALRNDNAAGEYYLTDVVAQRGRAKASTVVGVAAGSETEVLGVNSPAQLADLERRYQRAPRSG